MNTTTTTAATLDININVTNVNEALVRTAQDKLMKSAGKDSLDDLIAARTRRSLMLCDTSSSMNYPIKTGDTRIGALRKVVAELLETHPVPVAAFGGRSVRLVDGANIPYPSGCTPMASAINYAKSQGANHAVLITDGESTEGYVIDTAANFGGPIDVFFIGDATDHGIKTAKEIARITGGQFHFSDLGQPKELGTRLKGLLGDGSF